MKHKNLLVTLADEKFIKQAKQLFSSAYFNGGWDGDYMLLSHEIPEIKLKWFRDKGILIKKCKPLIKGKFGFMSGVVSNKFYLFNEEFKKWKNIVFLDADIIVKMPLSNLKKIKGFGAAIDSPSKLDSQFAKKGSKIRDYNLNTTSFNSGVFSFNTEIIKKDTFEKIIRLFEKYKNISKVGEQGILNLFFYKKWTSLPTMYNLYVYKATGCFLFNNKVKGILHFIGERKPWNKNNPYYREWKSNLRKAELIDIKKPIKLNKIWTKKQIQNYSRKLIFKMKIYSPIVKLDKLLGKFGIILKKISKK
ncbi:hypothetical protein KY334_07210 [Candidatus Woesearchaeota archaeon]|nr:hypothetical protein [Candidatus Woesearchaeota archaeon]